MTHLARRDAWTKCVVKKRDTKMEQGEQRQTLLTAFYDLFQKRRTMCRSLER